VRKRQETATHIYLTRRRGMCPCVVTPCLMSLVHPEKKHLEEGKYCDEDHVFERKVHIFLELCIELQGKEISESIVNEASTLPYA
jgi:hypothetical protein